jgi:hypothetical protein
MNEIYLYINFIKNLQRHSPILVTSDLEVIQEILVKQYANFSARKVSL